MTVLRKTAHWLLLAFVAYLVASRVSKSLHTSYVGMDFHPMHQAGKAVLAEEQVWDVPAFVYPPLAALVAVPMGFIPLHTAVMIMTWLLAVAVTAAMLIAARMSFGDQWLTIGAALSILTLKSDVAVASMPLTNVSPLLAVPALFILALFSRGRWHWGMIILAATIAFKPILIPFLVIPILARKYRITLTWCTAFGVLSVLILPLVGSMEDAIAVARVLTKGSNLVGDLAEHNLSIKGLAEVHNVVNWGMALRMVVIVFAVAVTITEWRRRVRAVTVGESAGIGAFLLGALYLAGPLSEYHYLLVLIPVAVLALARLDGTKSLRIVGGVGLAHLLWCDHYVSISSWYPIQMRMVMGELLITAALGLLLFQHSLRTRIDIRAASDERSQENGVPIRIAGAPRPTSATEPQGF